MTLTTEQSQDLSQMRIAASQREWTTLQDTFKRLIADLDPLIALSVVAPRVQAFFPKFHHYYPDAGWAQELFLTVMNYASAPNDLPIHNVRQFPSPGCGNFLMAIFDLARAVQQGYETFERYSHITNAAANAILADLQYTYFKNRLDLFQQFRDADTGLLLYQHIQVRFWMDDVVGKRDTALWLHLADLTASALERG